LVSNFSIFLFDFVITVKGYNVVVLDVILGSIYLVHYREIDVGEASEPEGCSSLDSPTR